MQVETGYLFARDGDVDGYEVPGTLFRIGLSGWTELRIGHGGHGRRRRKSRRGRQRAWC